MARGTARSEGSTPDQKKAYDFNKYDAVRKALEALGSDAKPAQINVHVKKAHGQTLPNTLISSYKSSINKKAGTRSGIHRQPGRRGGAGGGKKESESFSIDDFRAVKELADRLGTEKFRDLAELFSK